jgi:hypothetical protein
LEIKKTKPTFIITVLKVEYEVVLVSLISNCFSNKISHANKWMRKKKNLLAVIQQIRPKFLMRPQSYEKHPKKLLIGEDG